MNHFKGIFVFLFFLVSHGKVLLILHLLKNYCCNFIIENVSFYRNKYVCFDLRVWSELREYYKKMQYIISVDFIIVLMSQSLTNAGHRSAAS